MDIVEWLRTYGSEPSRLNEAADEIERLREALSAISASELVAKFNPNVDVKMMWIGCTNIARSALQQKDSEE